MGVTYLLYFDPATGTRAAVTLDAHDIFKVYGFEGRGLQRDSRRDRAELDHLLRAVAQCPEAQRDLAELAQSRMRPSLEVRLGAWGSLPSASAAFTIPAWRQLAQLRRREEAPTSLLTLGPLGATSRLERRGSRCAHQRWSFSLCPPRP